MFDFIINIINFLNWNFLSINNNWIHLITIIQINLFLNNLCGCLLWNFFLFFLCVHFFILFAFLYWNLFLFYWHLFLFYWNLFLFYWNLFFFHFFWFRWLLRFRRICRSTLFFRNLNLFLNQFRLNNFFLFRMLFKIFLLFNLISFIDIILCINFRI